MTEKAKPKSLVKRDPVPVRKPLEDELLAFVSRSNTPLVQGRTITCPACERSNDVLAFTPLQHSSKYASQVIVPIKCPEPDCRHTFALHPNPGSE